MSRPFAQRSKRPPIIQSRLSALATRLLVWGSLFAVLYVLRSFFLLLFLTFVFAYVQSSGVDRLGWFIQNRIVRVFIVGVSFLGILISLGLFLVPQVQSQAKIFANQFGSYVARADEEILMMSKSYPLVEDAIGDFRESQIEKDGPDASVGPGSSVTIALLHTLVSPDDALTNGESVRAAIDAIRNIGARLLAIGSAFLLALILSFLIVLDLPRLSQSVHNLQKTKLSFIYDEVAESIFSFSRVLGRALEAQLVIAIVNTVLTAAGMVVLGLSEKIAFLSVIVFICSFVPVAGVFVGTIPICLVALQKLGLNGVLLAILLITFIHVIEGYVLNPRIYGSHLRINPVIVLIILTIAGKLFGAWGLILGVPVCSYFFQYAIRDRSLEASRPAG